jgi:hypothetical protein
MSHDTATVIRGLIDLVLVAWVLAAVRRAERDRHTQRMAELERLAQITETNAATVDLAAHLARDAIEATAARELP